MTLMSDLLQAGRIAYLTVLRAKDTTKCPIGALAEYLLVRYTMSKEVYPSVLDMDTW
jgi:hypothetical protein